MTERKQGLGGSDIAPILGLSRWRTGFDVWVSKTQDEDPEKSAAAERWLRRGRILEPAVGKFYEEETGFVVKQNEPFTIETGPEPWMRSSVDFKVYTAPVLEKDPPVLRWPANPSHGLECKTSRRTDDWGPQGSDLAPMDAITQSNWYMAVTGLPRWDIAVFLTMTEEFRWYRFDRDEELITEMVDRARAWWEKHIVGKTPPPIDASDGATDWLRRRFPRAMEPLRPASAGEQALAMDLSAVRKQKAALEKREKELKNNLAAVIGAAEGFSWEGGKATYRGQERTSLDQEPLKAAHPDLVKKFEKTTSFRVLRVSTSNGEE